MENNGQKSQLSAPTVRREEDNMNLEASNEQVNHTNTGDSSSETNNHKLSISDSKSGIGECVDGLDQFEFFNGIGLIRLEEGGSEHNFVKQRFFTGMGSLEKHTRVVAIHKNSHSSLTEQARLQSFKIFSQAMIEKRGNNANIRPAWYSTCIDEICKIVSHGFGLSGRPENRLVYGVGIYLFPANSSIDCAISSVVDRDGLRHIMFCRAILGNLEFVHPGSQQFHPSSEEFDSGVDNPSSPKRFIVWTTHINTFKVLSSVYHCYDCQV